jgi:CHAT domain-containing protein/Flp pilus assembly protein TadD
VKKINEIKINFWGLGSSNLGELSVPSFLFGLQVFFLCLIIVFSNTAFSQSNPLELAQASRQLAAEGKISEAISKGLEALKGLNKQSNKNYLHIAYVNDDIAALYYRSGQLKQAKAYAKQAFESSELIPNNNPNKNKALAHIARNQGSIAIATGEFSLAEKQLQTAYQIDKSSPQFIDNAIGTANTLVKLYLQKDELQLIENLISDNLQRITKLPSGEKKNKLLFQQYLNQIKSGIKANNKDLVTKAKNKADTLSVSLSENEKLEYEELQARVLLFQSDLPAAEEKLKNIINAPIFKKQEAASKSLILANANYNLGFVYILQGKVIEAEPVVLKALKIYRKSVGADNPIVGRTLHQLAIINKNIGRLDDAEAYYQQALSVFKKAFGLDHETMGATRLEYALLLSHMKKFEEAKKQSNTAISLFSSKPNKILQLGFAYSSLGFVNFYEGNYSQAEPLFVKAIGFIEKARGKQSADLPPGLIKLAEINVKSGDNKKALKYINRAINLLESMNATSPYGLIKALSVKSSLVNSMGETIQAQQLANKYFSLLGERLAISRNSIENLALEEQREVKSLFKQYIDVYFPLFQQNQSSKLAANLFDVAQYSHMTGTASAIRHMSTRIAVKDKRLSTLLKQREQWAAAWVKTQKQSIAKLAGMEDESTAYPIEKIKKKIDQLDNDIYKKFPAFAELTNPKSISHKKIQTLLREDEAFFLQLTEKTGTTLFYIDKEIIDVVETDLESNDLTKRVNKIRHSMDLTRSDIRSYTKMPAYEVDDAYYLYEKLLKPFKERLQNKKHLMVVLDGAMQNLPLGVLVSDKTNVNKDSNDYRSIKFVGHEVAYSVYPSPSSFVALRSLVPSQKASKPFIGIGDPDLKQQSSETRSFAFTLDTIAEQIFKHSNPGVLRAIFSPLPETKIELELIAKTLRADEKNLILGQEATETKVKNTKLSQYEVIGFATHGLLAGEFKGLLEPALVLTPPEKSTTVDNGLLMASEIANLKLNAEWIVLSACNTAGPSGRPGAEGLSGLAKSFFHAGARSLLVSHWAIDSTAAAFVTTRMMSFINQEGLNKSLALKKSIKELAYENKPYFSHPAFWGAFVIVGEG